MKKFLVCVLIVCMLYSCSFIVFANDLPECLLHDDYAQIFFAQVVEYQTDAETPYVKMKPVKIIKGDVTLGEEILYNDPRPFGNFNIKQGKAYLLALTHKKSAPYIFRCDGYDTQSLDVIDLKDRQGGIERIERYLITGQYEEAEAQRRQKKGLAPQQTQIDGELPPLHTLTDDYIAIFNGILGAAGVIVFAIPVAYIIKKRKSNQTSKTHTES